MRDGRTILKLYYQPYPFIFLATDRDKVNCVQHARPILILKVSKVNTYFAYYHSIVHLNAGVGVGSMV